MPGERERETERENLSLHMGSCFPFSSPHNPHFIFPHSLLNLIMEHKFMCYPKQMPSQLVDKFFFFMAPGILNLSRAPWGIVCNTLARMLLAIDEWAINAFAICTLELVKRRFCPVEKGSQILQLCRSISSCPTSWPASTTLLVMLIIRCLVGFSCAVVHHKSRTSLLRFTSSTLHLPRHVSRVAYGFDVGPLVNDTLCGACEWSHCWTARSSNLVVSS